MLNYVSVQRRCQVRIQRIAIWHIRSFLMRETDTGRICSD